MKRKLNLSWIFVFAGAIALVPSAQALIRVGRGNQPVHDPGWPEGSLAVANLQSRVGWWEGPPFGGGLSTFLYRGDDQAFSEALDKFAAIHTSALDVVIHDGPEESSFLKEEGSTNSDTRIDWSFTVWEPESWNRLYNDPKHTFLANQREFLQPVDPPRLDVYIGGRGQVDWARVTVPANIRVRDERAASSGVDLSGGAVIRATVTDLDTGAPVQGAHLVLDKMTYSSGTNAHWDEELLVAAATDSSGVAQIERIQTNQIRVSVTADGYARRRIVQRILRRPELMKFTVELVRAASIQGMVIDAEDRPVAGVKVRPMAQLGSNGRGYDTGSGFEPFDKSVVNSDSKGRFEFNELPTGYVQFYAHAPGYYFTDSQTTFNVPSNNIVLHLRAAGSVSVAVTGKDGKRISKYDGNPVIVNLDPKGGSGPSPVSSMATVNEEGLCEFRDMPPGEYRVSSRPNPGHAKPTYPPDQIVTVTAGKRTSIEMTYETSSPLPKK